jgi:hypothetical protein
MLQVMSALIASLLFAPPATPSDYERDWTGQLFGLSPGIYSCADDAPSDIRAVDIRADGSFLAIAPRGKVVNSWGTWWLSGDKLELRFFSDGRNPFRSEKWEVSMGDLIRPVGKRRSAFSSLKSPYSDGPGIVIGLYTAEVPWRQDRSKSVRVTTELKADGTFYVSHTYPDGKRSVGAGRWWMSGRDLQCYLSTYDGKKLDPQKDVGCSEYVIAADGKSYGGAGGVERVTRFTHRPQHKAQPDRSQAAPAR